MTKKYYQVLKKLDRIIVKHPSYVQAFRQIEEAFTLNETINCQQNLICIGMSGTGKSTLKRSIQAKHPSFENKGSMIIPVLIVDTPSLPTVKSIAETVLIELGDPLFSKGSAVEKTQRIFNFIKKCKVRLIIFDELQHFIDQGNKSSPRQVSDWLKTLIDGSGASTVLMGLEQSEKILRINEQLRRRFSARIDLKPFSLKTESEYTNFILVLLALLKTLDLPNKLELSEDLVHRFYYATEGIIGYMVTLITAAYKITERSNMNGITKSVLEMAFKESIWASGVIEKNPFNDKFNFKTLDKYGMPFYIINKTELI